MSDLGNKDVFAKNLKYYMDLNNKTRYDIAKITNVPYSTVSSWCNALYYPRIDKIEMLANYFNILKSDLVENKEKRENISTKYYMCPMYNKIQSEEPYFVDNNIVSRIILDTNIYNIKQDCAYFSIEVNNNYTNFRNTYGNYIIFQKDSFAKDDDVVLVIVDNSVPTIKKYKKLSNGIIVLHPIDLTDCMEPLVIDTTKTKIHILGKAIGYFGKMEMK